METRAAVAHKADAPLSIETVTLDGPKAGDVAENGDAMEVLDGGGLHPQAVAHLKAAGELLELALETKGLGNLKQTIRDAIDRQEQAREEMLL